MNRTTKSGKTLTDEEIAAMADDFETTHFTPEDVAKMKKTRGHSPRLGDTQSESQVIRDALNANL